jgi:hypothetical protein
MSEIDRFLHVVRRINCQAASLDPRLTDSSVPALVFPRFHRCSADGDSKLLKDSERGFVATVCNAAYLRQSSGLLIIRQLIFRNYSLDIFRLAPDAVSNASIRLDGHTLDNGVKHWWINRGTTTWTLWLVANVFIELVGM